MRLTNICGICLGICSLFSTFKTYWRNLDYLSSWPKRQTLLEKWCLRDVVVSLQSGTQHLRTFFIEDILKITIISYNKIMKPRFTAHLSKEVYTKLKTLITIDNHLTIKGHRSLLKLKTFRLLSSTLIGCFQPLNNNKDSGI